MAAELMIDERRVLAENASSRLSYGACPVLCLAPFIASNSD
jgi:hypothetical protein